MMDKEQTFSVAEAGTALGVSPRTARRWCKEGKLPAQKAGKSYLIGLDEVEQMRRALGRKKAPMPAEEAVSDASCSEDIGQITEADESADVDSDAVVETVTVGGGDETENGQIEEDEQDAVGQLADQVEKLQARLDRISQLLADKVKKLAAANRELSDDISTLAVWLVVMAVVFILAAGVVAITIYDHYDDYAHITKWQAGIQEAQDRREKEAMREQLAELAQARDERKTQLARLDTLEGSSRAVARPLQGPRHNPWK